MKKKWFTPIKKKTNERPYTLKLYIPCRTSIVLCTYECAKSKDFEIPEMPVVTGDHLHDENAPVQAKPIVAAPVSAPAKTVVAIEQPKATVEPVNKEEIVHTYNPGTQKSKFSPNVVIAPPKEEHKVSEPVSDFKQEQPKSVDPKVTEKEVIEKKYIDLMDELAQ